MYGSSKKKYEKKSKYRIVVRNDETHDEKTEDSMLDKKFHGRSEATSKHKENKEQHWNCGEHQYSK